MITKINLLFIGDVVGEDALDFLKENLETLRAKFKANFIKLIILFFIGL